MLLVQLKKGWMLWLIPLLWVNGCGQTPPPDALLEGKPFPALVLPGVGNEQDVSIDSFRGRLVILNIWATWCGPCRRELPGLQRLSEKLDPEQFVVIGLSVDDDAHVMKEYLIDKGVTYPNFMDKDMEIAKTRLGIRVYPDTFLISPEGILLRSIAAEREWDNPGLVRILEEAYQGRTEHLQDV